MAPVIVLDASVLIAFLDTDDEHHAAAETLVTRAVDDDLAVSTLTLAEVLVGPVRDGRVAEVVAAVRDLEIEELTFPPEAALRLAQLRASVGLKMPDCCVLLAAERTGATVASFDHRLARAAMDCDLPVLRG